MAQHDVSIYGVSDGLIEVEVTDKDTGEVIEAPYWHSERGVFVFTAEYGAKLTVTVEYGDEEWEISTKMTTRSRTEDYDDCFIVRHGGRPDRLDGPMITVTIDDGTGETWDTDLTED